MRARQPKDAGIFADKRYRAERIFLVASSVGIAVIAAVFLVMALHRPAEKDPEPSGPPELLSARPPTPTEELESALRGGDSEAVRAALAKLPAGGLSARRGRARLAMIEDNFTEARREWDGIIAESPDAEGFFLRGICLEKLGEPAEADFSEAAARSPSNVLFSNKLYLVFIRSGQRKSVAEKIRTGLELRNESLQSGWTVAYALIALQEDNRLLAEMLLDRAAGELSPAELALLLEDPAFDPYRASPSLSRFFRF